MVEKQRRRNADKERYRKRERVKKANKQLKRDRDISRENRSFIRRQVLPYYHEFRSYLNKVVSNRDNLF